jgi:Uma2 family endonuclease
VTLPPAYVESLAGQTHFRRAPTRGHEILCDRLHAAVAAALSPNSAWHLLPRRHAVSLTALTEVCPDLALVRRDSARPMLLAEILVPGDHHADTVIKKHLYQDAALPTLWIVDPRYLNVETYRHGPHGFRLESILALRDKLTDPHLPDLALPLAEFFAPAA